MQIFKDNLYIRIEGSDIMRFNTVMLTHRLQLDRKNMIVKTQDWLGCVKRENVDNYLDILLTQSDEEIYN